MGAANAGSLARPEFLGKEVRESAVALAVEDEGVNRCHCSRVYAEYHVKNVYGSKFVVSDNANSGGNKRIRKNETTSVANPLRPRQTIPRPNRPQFAYSPDRDERERASQPTEAKRRMWEGLAAVSRPQGRSVPFLLERRRAMRCHGVP